MSSRDAGGILGLAAIWCLMRLWGSRMPVALKILCWIGGAVIALWSFAQAVEYFYGKYKEHGPGLLVAAFKWHAADPFQSTAVVALAAGVIAVAITATLWPSLARLGKQKAEAAQATPNAAPAQVTAQVATPAAPSPAPRAAAPSTLPRVAAAPSAKPVTPSDLAVKQLRLDDLLREADDAPVSLHTFRILLEEGTTFSLGPCPDCLEVKLGALKPHKGVPEQEFIMRGDIFDFVEQKQEGIGADGKPFGRQIFGLKNEIAIKNAPGAFSLSLDRSLHARLPLLPNAEIEINTKKYQIRLIVVDTTAASLRIRAEVRAVKSTS